MPAKRDLDPGASPLHFLGAAVPCDASTVSKIEAGLLHPTERFLVACTEAFPGSDWLARFYQESRSWGDGPYPRWFEDWLNVEREATSLHIWQPLVVPGLLQTADYARALFRAGTANTGDEAVGQLAEARLARQRIFDRPDPPSDNGGTDCVEVGTAAAGDRMLVRDTRDRGGPGPAARSASWRPRWKARSSSPPNSPRCWPGCSPASTGSTRISTS